MKAIPKWAKQIPHSDLFQNGSLIEWKIFSAVLAYAAGDAFGVPYEFKERKSVSDIKKLESAENWPFGGVSDDTLLSILTLESLPVLDPLKAAETFLQKLQSEVNNLRGLGPTTRNALGLPIKENELESVGSTNGGMMRTALCGLAFNSLSTNERRAWIAPHVAATHKKEIVVECALALSAAFSKSLELVPTDDVKLVTDFVVDELKAINATSYTEFKDFNLNTWQPPTAGTSLDPIATLKAVLWSVSVGEDAFGVYKNACSLGGDTDTVAALAGSLFVVLTGDYESFFEIEWLEQIAWHEIPRIGDSIMHIVNRRVLK